MKATVVMIKVHKYNLSIEMFLADPVKKKAMKTETYLKKRDSF